MNNENKMKIYTLLIALTCGLLFACIDTSNYVTSLLNFIIGFSFGGSCYIFIKGYVKTKEENNKK